MASQQHGLHTMNASRPKSKLSKRNNKQKARERKAILLKELESAVKSAKKGSTAAKKPATTKTKEPVTKV